MDHHTKNLDTDRQTNNSPCCSRDAKKVVIIVLKTLTQKSKKTYLPSTVLVVLLAIMGRAQARPNYNPLSAPWPRVN